MADDHAMVRSGLQRIIDSEPGLCVIGQAVDGASTLAGLQDACCDVVLLDMSMPAPSGPTLIAQIRARWPDLPIL
ncbi:MAG: response regulator transcription factor, partial [Hydrogenophaga sp.]|nr:response regulator transcription factor [Hydrogenophaga sp.]